MLNELPEATPRPRYVKIANVVGLYRDSINGRYYGAKKLHGKRREVSLKTNDRRVAERRIRTWIDNLEKVDAGVERTRLRNLVKKFEAINQGKSASTRCSNACVIRLFERTWPGGLDMEVREVRPSHLDEWLARQESRGIKNTTRNRYSGFLKALFAIAVKDRIIAESPFDKVCTSWKRPQTPVRRIPTREQFEAIINSVRSQPFTDHSADSSAFLEFLGLAALGQAEASAITWDDVDWERKVIRVHRRKTDTPFAIPIYPHLRPLLERLNAGRSRRSPGTRIFKIKDAKKSLTAACKRLGLPHFSQRNLRQFGIGLLWKAGIDKKLIAKWQCHSDGGELILSTYTQVFGDDQADYEQQQLAKLESIQLESGYGPALSCKSACG